MIIFSTSLLSERYNFNRSSTGVEPFTWTRIYNVNRGGRQANKREEKDEREEKIPTQGLPAERRRPV